MVFKYFPQDELFKPVKATNMEINQCKLWFKRHVKGYRFNPVFKFTAWDGTIDFWKDGNVELGLWKELIKSCKEIGSSFDIENKQEVPIDREVTIEKVIEFCKMFFKDHVIKKESGDVDFFPYDYQIETAYRILKNRYCLAEVATSGGKSLILSIVFFYTLYNIDPDAKFLIIVPSIDLVTQFYDNMTDFNNGIDGDNKNKVELRIEEIMSSSPRKHTGTKEPNIYISTYQSLTPKKEEKERGRLAEWANIPSNKKTKKWYSQFYGIAVDESHKAAAESLKKILKLTKGIAKLRFGVSGTFPNDDTAEILTIQSCTGPIITSIKAKMLMEKGKISPVEIRRMILNHDDPTFEENIKEIFKGGQDRGKVVYDLESKYVSESERRLDFISKLITKCSKNTLVLFNYKDYGNKVFERIKEDYPDAIVHYIDGDVKKRKAIIDDMNIYEEDVKRILVASFGTTSTGISIPSLSNIIFAESFKSEIRIIQSIGRGLRLFDEKQKAIVYDLIDIYTQYNPKNIYYRHGEERRKMYDKHQYEHKTYKFNL